MITAIWNAYKQIGIAAFKYGSIFKQYVRFSFN